MIRFQTIDVMMPQIDQAKVKAWIEQVIALNGKRVGELYYYFCSDDKLLEINKQRLSHDFFTDICTFPLTDCETTVSSEFCISLDRVAENSLMFGRTFQSELHRVIIHGVLHLVGFDDLCEAEEKEMRMQEEICLDMLFK